ncbi:ribokinase [Tissierella sp. Yu-01]|uniref:ribokinase n=1 Tax=Tissierella sp. Yu-01 TaxID=3035694 RepID=UPI00240E8877|nr:ribokinase [Tissierella sp. Yu-01]WFA10405.1 ribokinase [Tissierella sp. Yu-01]
MSKVIVVGSMNMDLVIKTDEIPKVGETLLGHELLQIPGGKGANQGVAIAKLGNDITFLGKVGRDSFGDELLASMKNAGVDIGHIEREDTSTGIAVINVDKYGRNNIVVIPGANAMVDKEYLGRHLVTFEEADIVVFQLEIPLETVKEGLRIAKESEKITILNPAPAMELDDEIISNIDILIPNEHELERMTNVEVIDDESILKASRLLLNKGIKQIIVTLGSKGVLYIDKNGNEFFKAYNVNVVDTTAAGDSFIGGFLTSFIEDRDIKKAINMGQKTAALAIQKVGAQSSLPNREEVENFK